MKHLIQDLIDQDDIAIEENLKNSPNEELCMWQDTPSKHDQSHIPIYRNDSSQNKASISPTIPSSPKAFQHQTPPSPSNNESNNDTSQVYPQGISII